MSQFTALDPEKLGAGLGKVVKEAMDKAIAKATAPLLERIAAIEDRGVRYRGQFNASDDYQRGDLVTFKGSMFHCVRDCSGERPHWTDTKGQSRASSHWQLAVQRGRDAREAR